jgi:hypothetical protein
MQSAKHRNAEIASARRDSHVEADFVVGRDVAPEQERETAVVDVGHPVGPPIHLEGKLGDSASDDSTAPNPQ